MADIKSKVITIVAERHKMTDKATRLIVDSQFKLMKKVIASDNRLDEVTIKKVGTLKSFKRTREMIDLTRAAKNGEESAE